MLGKTNILKFFKKERRFSKRKLMLVAEKLKFLVMNFKKSKNNLM